MSANLSGIKITQLNDIGANIAFNSLVPIVDMTGTPVTDKANLQIVGNLILDGAGGPYFSPAAQAVLSQTVTNAAQPNITSVGVLDNLSITDVSMLNIPGGTNGQFLQTNGDGNLVWAPSMGAPGGTNTQVQFNDNGQLDGVSGFSFDKNLNKLLVAGDVNANRMVSNLVINPSGNLHLQSNVNVYVTTNWDGNAGVTWRFGQGGALYWPAGADRTWSIEPNIDNEFEFRSTSNIVISTDINNTNQHFTFDSTGVFTAPSNVNLLGTRLNIGHDALNINYTAPTIVVADGDPTYIQTAQINTDANGSSDFAAYGSGSDGNTAFVDIGFSGANYHDPNYTLTPAGTGYVITQSYANGLGGSLVLATGAGGSSSDIIFGANGFLAENEIARFSYANANLELVNVGITYVGASPAPNITGFKSVIAQGFTATALHGNLVLGDATATGSPGLSSTSSVTFTANRNGTAKEMTLTTAGDLAVGSNIAATGIIRTGVFVTGTIPSASSAGVGARAFVTDATSKTFGAAYVGSAGNAVPVYSDGTSWFIG